MEQQQLLDLYFVEARYKLIEVAAFLDRMERGSPARDFRLEAFHKALQELHQPGADRARRVLTVLSDPTTEPIPAATTKAACGAWPGPSAD